jgi:NAD(P)-dependent dehydrogenase (short-subunit alcohol dehydrogenase family)
MSFARQERRHVSQETITLEGQVCLITGATRGIGFHTALGLAQRGAHVILVGHHEGRGEEATQQIRDQAMHGSADFVLADLASLDGMRHLADIVSERYHRLDVLVNNVGGFFLTRQETVDGLEMTFALDHLSYFVVTNLLLDLIWRSAPARIVNVSSESHRRGKMHLRDLQLEEGYTGRRAYNQAKLANLLFTYELARRLTAPEVTANALHPGFVDTHIGQQNPLVGAFLDVVHWLFAKSPEEGAQTPIYLAASAEVQGTTGRYYIDKEPVKSSLASYDEDAAARLWQISEELAHLQPHIVA